jgi:hypothetical protein
MEPEILRAAKARAVQDGVTVLEMLAAAAAKRALIDTDRQNTDAKLLAALAPSETAAPATNQQPPKPPKPAPSRKWGLFQ